MISNALKYKEKVETRGRKRKMSSRLIRKVVHFSKTNPSASAKRIKNDLNLGVSVETVRRRLRDNNLYARHPRKVPLLKKIHLTKRIQFVKEPI